YPHGPALEDITLEIADGEFVGVIGPNGSGKTTLLRAILGLMPPTRGSLRIFDCACQNLRCYHRARIGYLPQKRAVDPYFPITAREAVLMDAPARSACGSDPGRRTLRSCDTRSRMSVWRTMKTTRSAR